jgi:hypothetical protein
MVHSSPEVEHILSASPALLPLTRAALRPHGKICDVASRDADVLFPGARHGQAAFAGLLLRVGCWTKSHEIAQDVQSPEGSYWHGIIHRMEPDPSNAGYWFRQVGKHPIFPELLRSAAEILEENGPKHWGLKPAWDPFLFVEWCEEAHATHGDAEAAAIEIQMAEWQLLFDWCCGFDNSADRGH